jgi:hypothetical protein
MLELIFQNSLKDFTETLDKLLEYKKEIPKETMDSIKDDLKYLSEEFEKVDPTKEINDDKKKVGITKTLKELAYNLVDSSPQITEKIALITPLAPFSKQIGKGVYYFKDLIKHKLSEH